MRTMFFLSLAAVALGATACAAPHTASVNPGTATDTGRESCVRACNADYARCGDTSAARRDPGSTPEMFGAKASCNRALQDCLSGCKGR